MYTGCGRCLLEIVQGVDRGAHVRFCILLIFICLHFSGVFSVMRQAMVRNGRVLCGHREMIPGSLQGNGTAKIFEGDDRVITFSMHGANNYPWRTKMRSNYDVELDDGTEDATYLTLVEQWLPKLFDDHQPGLVFFQVPFGRPFHTFCGCDEYFGAVSDFLLIRRGCCG